MSSEPEQPEVTVVQGHPAQKLLKLTRRVANYRATNAGVLSVVSGHLKRAGAILARADGDNLEALRREGELIQAFAVRASRKLKELGLQRHSGLHEVAEIMASVERLLDQADRGGYKLATLQRKADIDRRTLSRLLASIRSRMNESAMVLAELEQAVDPVEGLHIVPASQRKKRGAKRPAPQPVPENRSNEVMNEPS